MPYHLPPVPPITKSGFLDPVWPRWLRALQSRVSASLSNLKILTANGFAGTIVQPREDQAEVTLSTTASGVLKGDSGALTPAVPGGDFCPPLSIATANGLSGTVNIDSPTSATVTLSTTVSGMVKGSGGALVPAVPNVDYVVPASYCSALSTTAQFAVAKTRTPVSLSALSLNRNFSATLPGTTVTCSSAGIYNLQYSVQLVNTDPALDDVVVWIVRNGVLQVVDTGTGAGNRGAGECCGEVPVEAQCGQ